MCLTVPFINSIVLPLYCGHDSFHLVVEKDNKGEFRNDRGVYLDGEVVY